MDTRLEDKPVQKTMVPDEPPLPLPSKEVGRHVLAFRKFSRFSLTPGGSQTLTFPGPPTGTSWRVFIACDYVGGPSGQSGGSFMGDVTY